MRVLVIDDDPLSLKSVDMALVDGGHDTVTFEDPLKAMKSFEHDNYEVVVTDIQMPGMSGIEVLKKVRAERPEIPVVIMTAYGDLGTAISALNNKAYAFFPKPVNLEEFMATIAEIQAVTREEKKNEVEQEELQKQYDQMKKVYEELKQILDQTGSTRGSHER